MASFDLHHLKGIKSLGVQGQHRTDGNVFLSDFVNNILTVDENAKLNMTFQCECIAVFLVLGREGICCLHFLCHQKICGLICF